jgi:hypothetical protein
VDGTDDDLLAVLGADRADLDEAQAAELRRQLADAAASAGALRQVPPPVGPGELRALLRECVNVVEPGDILIIQAAVGLTPAQCNEWQNAVNWWLTENAEGQVRALVVPAEEIKVLRPAPPILTFNAPPGEIDQETIDQARSRLEQVRAEHARPPQPIPPDPDTP